MIVQLEEIVITLNFHIYWKRKLMFLMILLTNLKIFKFLLLLNSIPLIRLKIVWINYLHNFKQNSEDSLFPEKIHLKPRIFFGKVLFSEVIHPEEPFTLQEWYRLNRRG